MRFENIGDTAWELVEAIDSSQAGLFGKVVAHQMFESQKLSGEFTISHTYTGCPFCGMKSFFSCGACGLPHCHDGTTEIDGEPVSVKCADCGNEGTLTPLEEMKLAEDYSIDAD